MTTTPQSTYQISTHCKFCRKGIILQIDSAYDAIRDPKNLMHLAACSRCADYRERSGKLGEQILVECNRIQIDQQFGRPKNEARFRALEKLGERFQRVIFQHYGLNLNTDAEFTRVLMDHPDKAGHALSRFRRAASDMAEAEKVLL